MIKNFRTAACAAVGVLLGLAVAAASWWWAFGLLILLAYRFLVEAAGELIEAIAARREARMRIENWKPPNEG